ncbi:MAG: hypothetical protein N5P05_000918 [Chroococcopsis gigantea SAG 12.99]|jgi:hypothetical protein|nr:DUF29 domain-containing protein [Chlorogloea purpurea SAG 13.99]MDV2999312.1 hypothetical protein [Chroococcopsis gigantea SAG 12.99]
MMAKIYPEKKSLYEKDFALWLATTAEKLKERRFDEVDLYNLVEEIEDIGKGTRRSLESFLQRVLEHLLKVAYWHSERERNLDHWLDEIYNFREEIIPILGDSPSLKPYLEEIFPMVYANAVKKVKARWKFDVPAGCPFTVEQILSLDWTPMEIEDESES